MSTADGWNPRKNKSNRKSSDWSCRKRPHRCATISTSIEKLWSDKLIVSGASNLLFTKSQLLAFFRAGLIRMKSLERRITRVVVDRDTAVTTGSDTLLPVVGLDSGKTVYCSYMNCWNREDGEWKLLDGRSPSSAR